MAAEESLHADRAARARKTKDKNEEADALFQAPRSTFLETRPA